MAWFVADMPGIPVTPQATFQLAAAMPCGHNGQADRMRLRQRCAMNALLTTPNPPPDLFAAHMARSAAPIATVQAGSGMSQVYAMPIEAPIEAVPQ